MTALSVLSVSVTVAAGACFERGLLMIGRSRPGLTVGPRAVDSGPYRLSRSRVEAQDAPAVDAALRAIRKVDS